MMMALTDIFKDIMETVDPKFYLDDILIYSNGEADLLKKLKILIPTLNRRNVTINGMKVKALSYSYNTPIL